MTEFWNFFQLLPLFDLPLRRRSLPTIPLSTTYSLLFEKLGQPQRVLKEVALILVSCDIHHEIGIPVDSIRDPASIACCFSTSWTYGPMCRCKSFYSKLSEREVLIFFRQKLMPSSEATWIHPSVARTAAVKATSSFRWVNKV